MEPFTSTNTDLQLSSGVEVVKRNLDTLGHGLLALTYPDTGVVVLLVRLVFTIRVADLGLEVARLAAEVVAETVAVCPLQVSVKVDLDDTVRDGLAEVLDRAARATVEDKENRLVLLGLDLLLDVVLVLLEENGLELDVSGLVDTVDVTEAGSDGEVRGDGGESLVDLVDVLGLGVEGVVVDILVVDTVLLATSDTYLHLEPLLHGCGTLEVLGGGLDVPVYGLLGQIDHVRREEGLVVLLEVGLIGIKHTIEPRQELLGAVVGVAGNVLVVLGQSALTGDLQNDGNAVSGSN